MSTKLLKREHRSHELGFSLRGFARHYATLFPRSPVGRASLAWLRRKSRTQADSVESEAVERSAQTQRVIAHCFPAEEVARG